MIRIERRGILRGLMSTALAAPLAQTMRMHHSVAAPRAMAVPKVVFFYTPCGVVPDLWHPQQTGTTFTLPKLSAPLAPYQSDCIFMDGISMYPLTDHQGGSQQLLAGDDKDVKTIDIQLGDLLNAPPIRYLQLGIQTRISKGGTPSVPHPHFTRMKLSQEVFAEDNPLAAFAYTFGSTSGGGNMMTDMQLAQLAKRKQSILDNATADLAALASRVPGSERQKLDTFTESLRALERRLTDPGTMAPSCTDFSSFNPTHFAVPQVGDPNQASYNQTANRGVVADLQMETARLALACGRTQVITLVYEHTNAHNPIQDLGPFGVHDSSHYNAPPGQLVGNATQEQKDAKMAAWQAYRVWYAQKLAQFIKMLKDTPDVTGSLLDNTIILHGSELGDGGPHKTDRIPYVFAGGKALGLKLGQALNFSGAVPAAGGAHAGIKNMAHSTLLTLIAKKFGLPLSGPFFGYSGPQALAPESIGVV